MTKQSAFEAMKEALEDLISDAEKQMNNPSHHMPFSLPKARAALVLAEAEAGKMRRDDVIPEGWQLAPDYPTWQMEEAGKRAYAKNEASWACDGNTSAYLCYIAMLAAIKPQGGE